MIRIVVADDHHVVREGLVRILNGDPELEVISEASNGKEAIFHAENLKPELLLIDLDMPVLDGMRAIPIIREKDPDLKIGVLSMHIEKQLVNQLMKMGINGYIYKGSDSKDLLFAVKAIGNGKAYFSPQITEELVGKKSIYSTPDKTIIPKLGQLTERERSILILVAQGKNHTEIGEELFISPRTVDTHRQNLMRKLEIKNLAGLVRFAIKSGLVE